MPVDLTYEEFGRRFFETAVTEERVGSAFAMIVGETMEVGPVAVGPGGIAKVRACVDVDEPLVSRTIGDLISFDVRLPLRIRLNVDLRVDRLAYDVEGEIVLAMTTRAVEPLQIQIDVASPRTADVRIGVASSTMRGEVVRVIGQVDAEIKRFVASYVDREIDKPEIRRARIIDVADELSRAFGALAALS